MFMRGLVCVGLLGLAGACSSHTGFDKLTIGGATSRIAGTSDLMTPRFPASGGLFLAVAGRDGIQNMAIFSATSATGTELASKPSTAPAGGAAAFDFGDDDSSDGSITATGGLVAFLSKATNLLPEDSDVVPAPERMHAYVRDLLTGVNELVSHNPDTGEQANADTTAVKISAGGRFLAFATRATNLHDRATNGFSHVYVYDRFTSVLQLITHRADGFAANGDSLNPAITPDGRFVAFETHATDLLPGDTNGDRDIVLYDRSLRMFERISFDLGGGETLLDAREPSISNDGLFVAFSAGLAPGDPRQILTRDRAAAMTELISKDGGAFPGNGDSRAPSISFDGMVVAFETDATNFGGDAGTNTDVFAYNRVLPLMTLVSIGLEGKDADGSSHAPSISPDGLTIAFSSFATNLVVLDASLGEIETAFADIFILPNPALP